MERDTTKRKEKTRPLSIFSVVDRGIKDGFEKHIDSWE